MTYGITVRVRMPADEVVTRVRAAVTEHGFEVLTEVDFRSALRASAGPDIGSCTILGVCDPWLAKAALSLDRRLGMLLPCTVVVRVDGEECVVEALDPQVLVSVPAQPRLQPAVDDTARRLRTALETLTAATTG